MRSARHPRHRGWLLAAWLSVCALPAQALQLQVADDALTPTQTIASRELLDEALRRLPSAWTAALDREIAVEWRDDLPAQVHGRAEANRILLDRELLRDWIAADANVVTEVTRPGAAATMPPGTRAALAAVIHELAHFYDRTPQGQLSRQPRLLDLAGWQVSPMRLGARNSRNDFRDRSPDLYELDSPVEFVAVNLEYFLLDPAYACRRPSLYRYFAAHFGYSPPSRNCAPGLVFLQPGSAQSPLLHIDPARVYAVDYLLAEGNDRFMSRWGHSMLRLVICAPERPPGPACRLDLRYHRVLSFRAFVDDVQISSWRGLTGSYPSRLFVLPLAQVIEEYTKVQLRGLQSIPLRLQPDEIASLLRRAAKLHWSYDGRYYFLSNNCAVETFKLLHDGVPRLADKDLASITPTGLLGRLREAGIADASVLDDRERARRLGFYFASASAHYQAMFEVADRALDLPQSRVQDWLQLPARQRTPWLRRAGLRASAALLLLENAALRRARLLARDDLKQHLFDGGGDAPDATAALDALRAVLDLEGSFSHPAALLENGGYGLPQRRERATLARLVSSDAAQWREDSERLRHLARQWLSPQRQAALETGQANIDLISARLRELNRAQDGFRL